MIVEECLIFLVSYEKLLQEKVGELHDLLHFLVTLSRKRTRVTKCIHKEALYILTLHYMCMGMCITVY